MAHTGAPPSDGHNRPADSRGRTRRPTNAGIILAAGVAVVIAFWLGRATAPPKAPVQSANCAETTKAAVDLNSQLKDQQAGGQTDAVATTARTFATLILQNPGCFNPSERATAQQFLDQHALDQTSQDIERLREAQCKAAGKGWWC
ncbi:hypothetical protein [Streptomyces violascens]|uniref:Uncharacterized protein n=1 Tax=Streptomyces violascens TaxID=67381 RepID=A0ABQ3QXE7_9ACTN|nr:hypothetical protein [Streptomyces violascens]GGU13387.1 hypothetical protein GCM10010289_38850 [Streptomyces violascens]GHI41935.1 hypothetical protein Sviol_63430 [Streptomyces violascens]